MHYICIVKKKKNMKKIYFVYQLSLVNLYKNGVDLGILESSDLVTLVNQMSGCMFFTSRASARAWCHLVSHDDCGCLELKVDRSGSVLPVGVILSHLYCDTLSQIDASPVIL